MLQSAHLSGQARFTDMEIYDDLDWRRDMEMSVMSKEETKLHKPIRDPLEHPLFEYS